MQTKCHPGQVVEFTFGGSQIRRTLTFGSCWIEEFQGVAGLKSLFSSNSRTKSSWRPATFFWRERLGNLTNRVVVFARAGRGLAASGLPSLRHLQKEGLDRRHDLHVIA